VRELLRAAVSSPSAINQQRWRFVVITSPEKIRELSEATKRIYQKEGAPSRFLARMQSEEDVLFYGAPLLILVCSDKPNQWAALDCGILAQTMFLAAYEMGLGSCFIGLAQPLNNDKALLASLGIPEGYEIAAPLIFGYPAERKPAQARTWEDKVLKRFE
jgi:nitroreductase